MVAEIILTVGLRKRRSNRQEMRKKKKKRAQMIENERSMGLNPHLRRREMYQRRKASSNCTFSVQIEPPWP